MSEGDAPRLVLGDGEHVIVLEGDDIRVGRLPDNDIHLDDPEVSRHHARFLRQDQVISLEDLGSSNGTFVNGTRIEGAVELHDDDSITFAGVRATVRLPAPTVPAAADEGEVEDRLPQAALEGIGLPPLLIEKADTTLGRAVDNDLVLDDPGVSGHHAVIAWRGDAFTLTDLGSANGTEVNGRPITGPVQLEAADEIRVGDTTLIFRRLMPARRRPGFGSG